jgi:hypothetical protein
MVEPEAQPDGRRFNKDDAAMGGLWARNLWVERNMLPYNRLKNSCMVGFG